MGSAETRDKRVQAFVVEAVRRSRRFALSHSPKTAFQAVFLSGRADLNRRPHGPEPCTLSGLSHAPNNEQ